MSGDEFISIGLANGFTQIPNKQDAKKEGLMLQREHDGEVEKITYWPESDRKTVRTYLPRHPSHGPGDMWKRPSRDELMSMLTEPTGPSSGLRTHTETGYRERRKDPARRKRR
jgi:hypothetical protein